MAIFLFLYRGRGYPSLWPSKNCQQPLDVSNEFTFKVIDGILSGIASLPSQTWWNLMLSSYEDIRKIKCQWKFSCKCA